MSTPSYDRRRELLARLGPLPHYRLGPRSQHLVFIGTGALSSRMLLNTQAMGFQRYTLVDSKTYGPHSVQNQCRPDDVGRPKVDVVGDRLRAGGAVVRCLQADVAELPDGILSDDSMMILSVDNRRAEIAAGKMALRMRRPLIKTNLETEFPSVTLRCWDFRQTDVGLCLECPMTERQYRRQRHPRSCDGNDGARRTASPVSLADTAAWLACKTLADLADEDPASADAAGAWYGMQTSYAVETNRLVRSRLVGNPHCRGDHDQRWSTPIRTAGDRALSTLRAVLRESFADGSEANAETRIQFCRHVAFRGRCQNCHQDAGVVHWVGCLEDRVGTCAVCGGALKSNGFDRRRTTTIDQLRAVLDQPFDRWGVADGAVVELTRCDRRVTWVLGNRLPTTSWCAENCRFGKGES